MSSELKVLTVNLKSLDQDIPDPIVVGGADSNGRKFRVMFDQEAAAQMTQYTKVYLSWFHQQRKVKGYNVFKKVNDEPEIWEIYWPKTMLHEGDVMCCVELVDDISIAASTNFIVHVLSDPNDGSSFVVSDDFTVFQDAVIRMNSTADKMNSMMNDMSDRFDSWRMDIDGAIDAANAARESTEMLSNKIDNLQFSAEINMNEF